MKCVRAFICASCDSSSSNRFGCVGKPRSNPGRRASKATRQSNNHLGVSKGALRPMACTRQERRRRNVVCCNSPFLKRFEFSLEGWHWRWLGGGTSSSPGMGHRWRWMRDWRCRFFFLCLGRRTRGHSRVFSNKRNSVQPAFVLRETPGRLLSLAS